MLYFWFRVEGLVEWLVARFARCMTWLCKYMAYCVYWRRIAQSHVIHNVINETKMHEKTFHAWCLMVLVHPSIAICAFFHIEYTCEIPAITAKGRRREVGLGRSFSVHLLISPLQQLRPPLIFSERVSHIET